MWWCDEYLKPHRKSNSVKMNEEGGGDLAYKVKTESKGKDR